MQRTIANSNYELAFPDLEEDSYVCPHGVAMTSQYPTICDYLDNQMEISESESDLLLLSKPSVYQRQTTICGINEETGCAVYNGNPNGDHLLEDDDDEFQKDEYDEEGNYIDPEIEQMLYNLEKSYREREFPTLWDESIYNQHKQRIMNYGHYKHYDEIRHMNQVK